MHRLTLGLAIGFGAGCVVAMAADQVPPAAKPVMPPAGVKLQLPGAPAVQIQLGKDAGKPALKAGEPPTAGGEAAKKPEPVPTVWTDADIATAKARCNVLLKVVKAVAVPEAPFRSGACGTPAPMRLISIGKNPEVSLSPPPVMTCEMIAALDKWIKSDVQPLARKHLGEPVINIDTMSDYSCRAAYGRKGKKLSEHGRANALDIRGFFTAKGQQAHVLADWGQTQRDITRAIAAAKTAAEKAEKERAAAAAAKPAPHIVIGVPPAATKAKDLAAGAVEAVTSIVKSTIIDGTAKSDSETPAVSSHGLAAPAQLGGPKQDTAALPDASGATVIVSKKGRFLREAHAAACRTFGTTLGPEANESHRNHFHVDMAERKNGLKICD